eukprot:Rmarinus@m.21029
MTKLVAIVTGANKGIGLEIVRSLCQKLNHNDYDVVLCSRTLSNGDSAAKILESEGLHPVVMQLDITDKSSIDKFTNEITKKYGKINILVNNAGMAYKMASTAPLAEQAEVTVACNFFGTMHLCNALLPHMAEGGRVVNVSSRAGQFANLSEDLRKQFLSPDLTEEELISLMNKFVADAKAGRIAEGGWPSTTYGVSKIGVTALTMVHARRMQKEGRNVLVNALCPGWCRTDMAGDKAPKTASDGADTPVWLATHAGLTAQGKFFGERQELDVTNFKLPRV